MAWIEVHQSLRDHRKLLGLADELSVSRAAATGHLVQLWLWCLDNAPSGILKAINAEQIATAAAWDGNPNDLVNALLSCGFLDKCGRGGQTLRIHDWYDYAGKLIERRKKDAEAKRLERVRRMSDGCRTDVGRTSDGCRHPPNTTKHHQTVPNHTEPNSSRSPVTEAKFGEICRLYESEIGPLTPMVDQRLQEIADGYPVEQFRAAIQEAVRQGKRSLAYVEGILKNYQTEGFEPRQEEGEEEDAESALRHLQEQYPRAFARGD